MSDIEYLKEKAKVAPLDKEELYELQKSMIKMSGRVQANGKTLWHIQNMNICSDGHAYDMFLWAENEPTQEELKTQFIDDYGEDEDMVEEWLTSSEVYAVYAEEI